MPIFVKITIVYILTMFIFSFPASVRNHTNFEKVTDQKVEMAVKERLVNAKDRDGGRAVRGSKISALFLLIVKRQKCNFVALFM